MLAVRDMAVGAASASLIGEATAHLVAIAADGTRLVLIARAQCHRASARVSVRWSNNGKPVIGHEVVPVALAHVRSKVAA